MRFDLQYRDVITAIPYNCLVCYNASKDMDRQSSQSVDARPSSTY
jgi:hypothetical protein